MLKAFLQVFGKSLASKAFSKYVTPLVCEALLPKYLTSGDVDDFYERSGIVPDSVPASGANTPGGKMSLSTIGSEIDPADLVLTPFGESASAQGEGDGQPQGDES